MANSQEGAEHWLPDARAGSKEAMGQALETCRPYLLRVADRRLAPDLRAKGGASDMVQQTFMEAQRDFGQFQGETKAELLAWLRQLLLNNMANFERTYRGTGKRQISREVALNDGDSSSTGYELAGAVPTPSRQAMENEEAAALERALGRLPEELRRVIELRHQQQYTFDEIARAMNRSASGARALWLRAIERLNEELGAPP